MPRAFLHVEVDGPAGPEPAPARAARALSIQGLVGELTDRIETIGPGRVTADLPRIPGLDRVARALEARIRSAIGQPPRLGLAPNAPLARLASAAVRPSGLLVIEDAAGDARVSALPVGALHGVGPVSERLLRADGVVTVGDLLTLPEPRLAAVLGPVGGARVFRAVHGRDPGFPRRSRSSERTFPAPVTAASALEREAERQLAGLLADLERDGLGARTLSLRLRTASGEAITRSRTLGPDPTRDPRRLLPALRALLHDRTGVGGVPVRTLGVTLTGLGAPPPQLAFPFD